MALIKRDARVEMLRAVPLFSRCSRGDLQLLARVVEELDFDPGESIVRESDRAREFFVVASGAAEVKQGKRTINLLGAGDFFGEIGLLTEEPRTATVVATRPTRVLVLRERDFKALVKRNAPMALRIMEALGLRLLRGRR